MASSVDGRRHLGGAAAPPKPAPAAPKPGPFDACDARLVPEPEPAPAPMIRKEDPIAFVYGVPPRGGR